LCRYVEVNWREGCKSKTAVAEGDVISLRGKGRVEIGEVSTTKKGRFNIELTRYL
jgi:RNA-binding protein YlmH